MIDVGQAIAWLRWGHQSAADATERRKIFNTNLGAALALAALLTSGALYLVSGHAALIATARAAIGFCLPLLLVPWLNRRGHPAAARWVFYLALMASLTVSAAIAQGGYLYLHFHFLLLGLIPVLFFPLAQWPALLLLFGLNCGLFLWFEQGGTAVDPALATLSPAFVLGMRVLFAGSAGFALLLSIVLAERRIGLNESQLESLSTTDALTGLLNRRGFEQRFAEMRARIRRDGGCAALIVIDLDNFKPLNDRYGHDVGDLLLKEIARRLRTQVREVDATARFGGDEFVLICHFPRQERDLALTHAVGIAEKLRASVAHEEYTLEDARQAVTTPIFHRCTISIGLTLFTAEEDWNTVFRRSDEAMFEAKRQGRNAVVAV